MKFNFKKIASVLASSAMMGSTVALAAAAAYPAPFVKGGVADVAVVWGTTAQATDLVAVSDITTSLQEELAKQTATTTTGGKATDDDNTYPLFGSGKSKIWLNESVNSARQSATKTNLPSVLGDSDFSGNVEVDLEHSIHFGHFPKLKYSQQPDSDSDPTFNIELTTNSDLGLYNATVTFNKAVNMSHPDSEGESIKLFGEEFTIGSATDATDFVLFRSSKTINLNSDSNPSEDVTIEGKTYTVELTTATDSDATIKLTDSEGKTDTKKIAEAASKKIIGVEVSVNLADESTALDRITAEITVGAEKVKLISESEVTVGVDDDTIDNTYTNFTGGTTAMTKMYTAVSAKDSDSDAILPGGEFVDPIFGSFKIVFAGLYGDDNREDIIVKNSGDDKMEVDFTNYAGYKKSVNWVYNDSSTISHPSAAFGTDGTATVKSGNALLGDSSGDIIDVREMALINKTHYVVVGNEDQGYFLELTGVTNSSNKGKVTFRDVFSGGTTTVDFTTGEQTADMGLGASTYSVTFKKDITHTEGFVTVNDPDSSGNAVNLFPTIETSKGAKVAFYQPTLLNLTEFDPRVKEIGAGGNNITSLRFPDGDGYTAIAIVQGLSGDAYEANYTFGGTEVNTGAGVNGTTQTVGRLTYNISAVGTSHLVRVRLHQIGATNTPVDFPGLIIFEEQDDNDNYEVMFVRLTGVGTSASGLGVTAVDRTSFSTGGFGPTAFITHESDSKDTSAATLWGSVINVRDVEDQDTATIKYPDEQVYAELYLASTATEIAGTSSTGGNVASLGSVSVKDSEASSVSSKNLIVVGGSCVNSVASTLLNGAKCGSSFTDATTVGSGKFLIETFTSPLSATKVATLVAGYGAADTANAAMYLRTKAPMTDLNTKYIGTSSTSATLETSTTTPVANSTA